MRRLGRLVMPAVLIVAAYYAVFGGEYSLVELRSARASAAAAKPRRSAVKSTSPLEFLRIDVASV